MKGISLDTGKWTLKVIKSGLPLRCAQSLEVSLTRNLSPIKATNDTITLQGVETLSLDVLKNDTGASKAVSNVSAHPELNITWNSSGIVNLTAPIDANPGEISISYVIRDGCGKKDTALLVIKVLNAPCQYTVEFGVQGAYCGGHKGSISAIVLPQDGAKLSWSSGSVGNLITGLAPNLPSHRDPAG
ncbi:MAG: hypothetical protein IPN29_06365 [Saprospiraceae bacterium]|nr:hypothetical protein [Saprospiraceae bacterium]